MNDPRLALFLEQIEDPNARENFRKLKEFLAVLEPFAGFRLFTASFTRAETNHRFRHNLGFLPKDVILTSKTGPGQVTFNQALSTTEELDITVTDACELRFLAGSFS